MVLLVPNEIDRIAWKGTLEIEDLEAGESKSAAPFRGFRLPSASIGEPEIWNLSTYRDRIPKLLQDKLTEYNFSLVRLACSLRFDANDHPVSSANFIAELLPDNNIQPIAFDLYPKKIEREVSRNRQVNFSPELKFQEIEGKLGSADFGIEYTQLQPVIIGTGVGESIANWIYRQGTGQGIQGSHFMHLIVKSPLTTSQVRIKMKLNAISQGQNLFARIRNQGETASDCLIRSLAIPK